VVEVADGRIQEVAVTETGKHLGPVLVVSELLQLVGEGLVDLGEPVQEGSDGRYGEGLEKPAS
jgi:hypothetical protein